MPLAAPANYREMPFLAFNLNDGNEFVFDLIEDRLRLGRTPDNDIVIDNTYISGHHAEFLRQADGGYELVDLQSSNGTFVNNKRIERSRVKGGDRLRFGQLGARFRERAPRGLAPLQTIARSGGSAIESDLAKARRIEALPAPSTEAPKADKKTTRQQPTVLSGVKMESGEVAAFARVERLRREQAGLEERRQQLDAEMSKTGQIKAAVEAAARELERLRAESETAAAAAKSEQERLEEARKETSSLQARRELLAREMETVERDFADTKKKTREAEAELKQAQAELAANQKEQQQQVEARLREQLAGLEEKHEILRRGLAVDEATVEMFARDIIKRLDLIDSLRQRFADSEFAEQLGALRASFEDVLMQHGVNELSIEPGTPVDVELRRRIVVVEGAGGEGPSRVAATRRSGFVRVRDSGSESILRKVEVATLGAG